MNVNRMFTNSGTMVVLWVDPVLLWCHYERDIVGGHPTKQGWKVAESKTGGI